MTYVKTAASMEIMKYDMAGAAAVLGAALTVARLGLPARLLVVVPAVENLPGGRALKPGDVITTAAGKTVEVLNTDAEGRVVLADALHYACGRRSRYEQFDQARQQARAVAGGPPRAQGARLALPRRPGQVDVGPRDPLVHEGR